MIRTIQATTRRRFMVHHGADLTNRSVMIQNMLILSKLPKLLYPVSLPLQPPIKSPCHVLPKHPYRSSNDLDRSNMHRHILRGHATLRRLFPRSATLAKA
jgi:hypothetical protein